MDLNVEIHSSTLMGIPFPMQKGQLMYNVNYMLAKALQKDHLREAKTNRISRLWEAQRKLRKALKSVK
jgi:hypothetical protein